MKTKIKENLTVISILVLVIVMGVVGVSLSEELERLGNPDAFEAIVGFCVFGVMVVGLIIIERDMTSEKDTSWIFPCGLFVIDALLLTMYCTL